MATMNQTTLQSQQLQQMLQSVVSQNPHSLSRWRNPSKEYGRRSKTICADKFRRAVCAVVDDAT